jgi:hypothetical protein
MINNDIKNWQGKTIGFRCSECGGVYSFVKNPSMWGNICNSCRETERRHQEILKTLKNQER